VLGEDVACCLAEVRTCLCHPSFPYSCLTHIVVGRIPGSCHTLFFSWFTYSYTPDMEPSLLRICSCCDWYDHARPSCYALSLWRSRC
jgi:hypothetical protein